MSNKNEMTPEERDAKEQEEFQTGPLRVLTDSVKNNTQVLINCRYKMAFHVVFSYLYNIKLPTYFIGTTRSFWAE